MDYSTQSNPNSNLNQGQSLPPLPPRNTRFPRLTILLILFLIIVAVVVSGLIWYSQKNQVAPENNTPLANSNYPAQNLKTPKEGTYFPAPAQDNSNGYLKPLPNTEVQWNGEPKLTADLKLVLGYYDGYNGDSSLTYAGNSELNYYDMGTHASNNIILAIAPAMDPGGPSLFFFEKKSDGKYIFMSKMSNHGVYGLGNSAGYLLSPATASADVNTYYNGIVGPVDLIWKGLALQQPYVYPSDLFTNYLNQQKTNTAVTIKKVDSLFEGDLYLYQQKSESYLGASQPDKTQQFYLKKYILKLKSGLYTIYDSKYTFFTDNSVPDITWLDGTKNENSYRSDASLGGCGNGGAYAVSVNDVSGMVRVAGTTGDKQSIYEFKDSNNPAEKFFYDLIDGKTYDPATNGFVVIPYQEWAASHPVVLYKNSLEEYVIFTSNKYSGGAECGKPVIYLYPTKPTNVKVQVGADITKSEPLYDKGWQVQANPDGRLKTEDGNHYGSLFWEGIGHGMYPSINAGFVVAQSELENTITLQLKELGLNEKESADFLEFWLPKMPATPYVRLTWFTTKQLDQLAPLIIWPRPDTTIRIFLDFQGLQHSVSLPVQHLTSLSRNGFVAVEWGGLLRK